MRRQVASQRSRASNPSEDAPIATVDGVVIPRSRVIDLLLSAHGAGVLEQLITLQAAESLAEDRGLTVTRDDIRAELDAALALVADPLTGKSPAPADRESAERSLKIVLSERNVSRAEFDIVLRRNALLRRIANSEIDITAGAIEEEYNRAYGPRAEVSHIQVASLAEVSRIQQRLAGGEAFEWLARRLSANAGSAEDGGRLTPFTRADDRLPEAFRAAAFSLEPGGVSDAVKVGPWFHLIRLERMLPAESPPIESVRDELQQRLRRRRIEEEMPRLYERLFDRCSIEIFDPRLRERFREKHPGKLR